ncbi:MAG: hypothetical protein ACTSSD_17395 [Candidatus Thorarchaeota archaeon]
MITTIIPYTLRLTAPVIMTSPSGDPNSASSMNYIPGSSIRGAVARGIGNDAQDLIETLILSGKVTYLNAYPEVDGRRALPIPYSYRVEKNDDSQTHDLAAYTSDSWPEIQMKKPQAQYVTITGPDKYVAEVNVASRFHHQRDRAMGRAWEEDDVTKGTVFVYDYMTEDQSFMGCIVIKGIDDAEIDTILTTIKELLGKQLILGRSRRAGYGGNAIITWHDKISRETSITGHAEVIDGDIKKGSTFRILFLSDSIVRFPLTGQVNPSFMAKEIERILGGKARAIQNFMYSRTVGGYNKKWGLEIPQSLAVGAGSLTVMEATANIPFSLVNSLEISGVGDRKIEGFGRLVFLGPSSPRLILKEYAKQFQYERPDSDPPLIVIEMERRILRTELIRECDLIARNIATSFVKSKNGKTKPSNSLIGRLRVPLRGPSKRALDILHEWFNDSSKNCLKSPAMNQLRTSRLRIDNRPITLLDWLKFIMKANYKDIGALSSEKICQDKHIISPESARQAIEKEILDVRAHIIDSFLSEVVRLRKAISVGAD